MASQTTGYSGDGDGPTEGGRRYPAGTGWIAGFASGAVVGVVAWIISAEVVIGVILLAATGTALGVTFEQSIATRPLTERERRIALILMTVGVLVGLAVLVSVVLFA
ncbi:MAG TPA: hypothetical protein VJ898_15160 [Natrialbaceae archaeon]|nr:hypothetical protein [Natrialbaceae archaeon]